ncbi:MAG: CsgG/HfaB family protein [Smithellaceae bacterium]|nr:CsgG/HfaB family protein [Smithellaceae bacterium]
MNETGIYEVIDIGDSKSVFAGNRPASMWEWAKKDGNLARRVGRAVHADYVIVIERSRQRGDIFWETMLLNVETGKMYGSLSRISTRQDLNVDNYKKVFTLNYREIFREAKDDMLATALKKSYGAPLTIPALPSPGPAKEVKEATALPPSPLAEKEKRPAPGKVPPDLAPSPAALAKTTPPERPSPASPQPIQEPPKDPAGAKVLDLEKILAAEAKPDSRRRLAVFDLESSESLKVVALILSEALREELHRLGQFSLVNRENLVQVLKEIEMQLTGLVEEKQAIQLGKGLAANQIVTGRFGALGKTAILQAKLIDVETQGTLALGSLKSAQGQEDELLSQLPELARKLAGLP